MAGDLDLLVDIDIPQDIQGGFDKDGLPRTEVGEKFVPPLTEAKAPGEQPGKPDPVVPEKAKDAAPGPKITAEELDALRKKAHDIQIERDRLAREAQQAKATAAQTRKQLDERTDQAMRAHWERVNANLDVLKGGIATAQSIATQAEQEYAAAREAGDIARETAAQRAIARAEAEMVALEQAKNNAEAEVERTRRAFTEAAAAPPAQQPRQQPQPTQQPRTPSNDEWIAACPKPTQDWLKQNVNLVSDLTQRKRLVNFAEGYALEHGGHNLDSAEFAAALAARFTPKKVEERMPDRPAQDDDAVVDVSPAQQPVSRTAPAAPVSRGPAPTKPSGPKGQVRLTPEEQAMAVALEPNLSPQEARRQYAIGKQIAEQEGRYAPRN